MCPVKYYFVETSSQYVRSTKDDSHARHGSLRHPHDWINHDFFPVGGLFFGMKHLQPLDNEFDGSTLHDTSNQDDKYRSSEINFAF